MGVIHRSMILSLGTYDGKDYCLVGEYHWLVDMYSHHKYPFYLYGTIMKITLRGIFGKVWWLVSLSDMICKYENHIIEGLWGWFDRLR